MGSGASRHASAARSRRISDTLSGTSSSATSAHSAAPRAHRHRPGPHDRQKGKGNHRQRDVPIPRLVATDLVVVQPGLALASLEPDSTIQRVPATRTSSARVVRAGP